MHRLDQDDEDDDRHPHDGGDVPLVAVPDGQVSQAPRAHHARDGRVAHDGDEGDGPAQDQGGHGLRQVDLPDDLEGGGPHGLGRLNDPGVHLAEGGLHHPGDEGGGGNHQRHHGAPDADFGAHQELGQGEDGNHQNDEGQGPADVDDPAQDRIDRPVGADAVGPVPLKSAIIMIIH